MNWKTTLTGALTILVAISGGIIAFLTTGHIPDLTPIIAAVTAGVGLITAKDAANKS